MVKTGQNFSKSTLPRRKSIIRGSGLIYTNKVSTTLKIKVATRIQQRNIFLSVQIGKSKGQIISEDKSIKGQEGALFLMCAQYTFYDK